MRNVTRIFKSKIFETCANMKFAILLVSLGLGSCYGETIKDDGSTRYSIFLADMWLEGGDVLRILWRDCSKKLVDVKDVIDAKEYFPKFMRCMKRKTLRALDRSLSTDIVPVADGINLVRYEMVDRSGNVMSNNESDTTVSTWTDKELDEGEWRTMALQRMARVLRTHVIKFDFGDENNSPEKAEYRGRRRHQMMTMMMFGVVSIGMVLIPMGFQFLAVLGGKALLLAKMALILASIQGLKKVDDGHGYDRGKIAASPLSYGFYHSYPPYEHFDKRSRSDWPADVFAGTAPPSLPRQSWLLEDGFKFDRISEAASNSDEIVTFKPELPKQVNPSEPRLYPVYSQPQVSSPGVFTSLDAPTPVSPTTVPTEVEADYSLDFPYNGIRFQSAPAVVSS